MVELWDHGDPLDSARNDALAELAARHDVDCVATNNVHYATPSQRQLATAMAAVRARRSLDELDPWLPAATGAHLRSRAPSRPAGSSATRAWSSALPRSGGPRRSTSPSSPRTCRRSRALAPGTTLTEMQYLRHVVEEGGRRRYGERPHVRATRDLSLRARAWTHDRPRAGAVIEQLGFAGYFLIVWDIVEFCRRPNIFCQGRGSAANSAVCYALGITAADAVSLGLLFERFLSPERDGPPDIDIDIESDRREEVIQYVYERYGRHHTAQVANVITYRARVGGARHGQGARLRTGPAGCVVEAGRRMGQRRDHRRPTRLHGIPQPCSISPPQVEDAPRHLGIHSGGMVICDRPVIEVCPVEWGRMDKRSRAAVGQGRLRRAPAW